MDPIELLKLICTNLRLPREDFMHAVSLFESSQKSELAKKYKKDVLAIGALYYHCKSTGKNVPGQHLKGYTPLTTEELIEVYNEYKKNRFWFL